jgi:hydroxymethylpyrimidine pyrophosphatase-like HAD family hydrolase
MIDTSRSALPPAWGADRQAFRALHHGLRFRVLALDYDGTIAQGGTVHPDVRAALTEARAAGIATLLVTGRRLDDLRTVAGDLSFADAVVGEGGAVVLYPDSGLSFVLSAPPSPVLLDDLRRLRIPAVAGQSIIEAEACFAPTVLDLIRKRELPLTIAFNRSRLMVLPHSVSKATGLREALTTLRLSAHNAIGIGDAENDHALLEACQVGVAVAWGSGALKAAADEVLVGTGPADVATYIRHAVAHPRLPNVRGDRRKVLIGSDRGPVFLPVRGWNVLITGESGSGKSWVTGLLAEQAILARYSVCVIDPEGDYAPLENLPGVTVLGHDGPPTLREVERALQYPDVSVVVDLSAMPRDDRQAYVPSLLKLLASIRRRLGFPHRIIVDEAHYFLDRPEAVELLDLELSSYALTTYNMARLDPRILYTTEAIIVTRESDPAEARALMAVAGVAEDEEHWRATLAGLAMGEAVLVTMVGPEPGRMQRFRTAPRLTPHVRHRHKYSDVPVAAKDAFVFTRKGAPTGRAPRTLVEFSVALASTPLDVVEEHRRRHDFSRWIANVFRDRPLAARVFALEQEQEGGAASPFATELGRAVVERYFPSDPSPLPTAVAGPAGAMAQANRS